MREIKFRGRERESNKWVFGYARHWKCCYGDTWHIQGENDNVHIVIPETIGQFTGLHDCKGQEIFEGDILFVKAKNRYWSKFDSKHVVTWCNDGWILNDYGTDDPGLFNILMNSDCDCEIIGNVHDNPELLEAKDA